MSIGQTKIMGIINLNEDSFFAPSRAASTDAFRRRADVLLDAGADTIVLGCTHYPFLLPLMQRIAPEGVRFIDPAPAVARRLRDVLAMKSVPVGEGPGSVELLASGPDTTLKKLFTLI